MNRQDVFRAVVPLVRPGGGIAVVTNGTPLWLQDTDWSRALRAVLERWMGTTLTDACGTDEQSQQRYRDDLRAAGFDVLHTAVDYVADLDIDQSRLAHRRALARRARLTDRPGRRAGGIGPRSAGDQFLRSSRAVMRSR
jgi:hypothetical protein